MGRSALNLRTTRDLALRLKTREQWLQHLAGSMDGHVSREERKKKSGGIRRIYKPSPELKRVQRLISTELLQPLPLPDALHGSVPGRSTKTNAEPHTRKPAVLSLDIKDFYPSVRYDRIYQLFLDLGCSPDVARLLTRLTTFKGHLAQGFPSSPAIANLVLAADVVRRLSKLCSEHGLTFTLYQDDLTVSGGYRIPGLISLFCRIFRQAGYPINRGKIKVSCSDERQEVTGWVVNDKVNASKDEYRPLRALIHQCRVRGIENVADRPVDEFRRHLRGRIQRVREVNPNRGNKLLEQFLRL
jgi:RNA-directed DNA polymerase